MILETANNNGQDVYLLVSQIESVRIESGMTVIRTKSGDHHKVHKTPTEVLKLWKEQLGCCNRG